MAHSDGIHHAIKIYGTGWCPDTTRSRTLLDHLQIAYNFYDIEKDPAMERTASALREGTKIPVVDLGDDHVLVVPSDADLTQALHDTGRLTD